MSHKLYSSLNTVVPTAMVIREHNNIIEKWNTVSMVSLMKSDSEWRMFFEPVVLLGHMYAPGDVLGFPGFLS